MIFDKKNFIKWKKSKTPVDAINELKQRRFKVLQNDFKYNSIIEFIPFNIINIVLSFIAALFVFIIIGIYLNIMNTIDYINKFVIKRYYLFRYNMMLKTWFDENGNYRT